MLVVPRSSDQRLAVIDRLTRRLSLGTDPDDIILNFVTMNRGDRSETISESVLEEAEGKVSMSNNGF